MMPQGASAITFSTHWHASANAIPLRGMPYAAAAAFMTATSTAADELTPLLGGTSDSINVVAPVVIDSDTFGAAGGKCREHKRASGRDSPARERLRRWLGR